MTIQLGPRWAYAIEKVIYLIRIWPHEITDQTVTRYVYRSLKKWLTSSGSDHMRSQTRPWPGTSIGLWRSDLPHQDLTTWDHRPDRGLGRLWVSEEVTYLIRIWPHETTDQTVIRDVYGSLKKWLTSSGSDNMRSQTRPWSRTSIGLWRSDLPHQDLTTWDHRPDRDQGRL